VTPGEYSAVSYATHHFCNPLSPVTLDRTLAFAELRPGDRALDLGCGNGLLALHLAERYGLEVEAVDIAPEMIALAQERVGDRGAPGRVSLRLASAAEAMAGPPAVRLVVANGSWGIVEGRPEPDRVLARLAEVAGPGGYVLWGEPFLRAEPPPRLAMLLQAVAYRGHADYVALGEAAGMNLRYAAVSPEQDFDDYILRIHANVERWFAARPDHPEAARRLAYNRMVRDLHLQEGRSCLGFGLYLFQA
jgi:SAM-dependent methyltransferase